MGQQSEHGTDTTGTVAFIGAGAMGEAIIAGLLGAGHAADRIVISDASRDRLNDLTEKYAVRALEATEAASVADVLVVAVKPKDVPTVLEAVGENVRQDTLVVSIAAGLTTASLESALPSGTAVVRVMPNTPALVGEGMSAVSGGRHCTSEQLETAEQLMRACGRALVVPEMSQDAVTAVSGSGPAYVFAVIEAMIDGGVALGLTRDTARELVVQTVYGAATMVKETGEHPGLLRERVSSPGGTTVAALRELDERAVRAAFQSAMEAACWRSRELAGPGT